MDDHATSLSMQRAQGNIALHMCGMKIQNLYQYGCGKIMLPKTYGEMTEAVILNTSGGVTGGDRFDVAITADDCDLVVTTQTAERFYRSVMAPVEINISLKAKNGAKLHWLPQEAIVFDRSSVNRKITLDISSDSECLMAETVVLGRHAMGEAIEGCHFSDQWLLSRDGELFHAEALRLEGEIALITSGQSGFNDAKFLSTIIYAGKEAEALSQKIMPFIDQMPSQIGASSWQDCLIIRMIAHHPTIGRSNLNHLLTHLRNQALPRVWQV